MRRCARLFLAAICALLCTHTILSFALRDLRYSIWFDNTRYAQRLESEFAAELVASRQAIEAQRSLPRLDRSNASLCIAIASAPRPQPHLTVLIGSLLRGTSAAERRDTRVVVVSAAHEHHAEAEALADEVDGVELIRFDDIVHTAANESDVLRWRGLQTRTITFAAEVCLNHSVRVGSPYFVVLEDDGVVADSFVDRVKRDLAVLSDKTDWVYVKLFATDFYEGWERDDYYMGVALLAIWVLAGALWRVRGSSTHALVCALGGSFIWLMLLALGKQNVRLPPAAGLHELKLHVSSCAHVYSTAHARDLITFVTFRSHTLLPNSDIALNKFLQLPGNEQLRAFNLVPNLFQHTGLYSSCTHSSCAQAQKLHGDAAHMKQSSTFRRHQ